MSSRIASMEEVIELFNDMTYTLKKQSSGAEDKVLLELINNFNESRAKALKESTNNQQNDVTARETIALIFDLVALRNQISAPSQQYQSAIKNAAQLSQANDAPTELKQAQSALAELPNIAKETYKSAVALTSSIVDTKELFANRDHQGTYGSSNYHASPVVKIRKIVNHSAAAALKNPTLETATQLADTIKNDAVPMIERIKASTTSNESSSWVKFTGWASKLSGITAVVAGIVIAATAAASVATLGVGLGVIAAGFAILKIGDILLNSKPTTTKTMQNADGFAEQATKLSSAIDNLTENAKKTSASVNEIDVTVRDSPSMRRK